MPRAMLTPPRSVPAGLDDLSVNGDNTLKVSIIASALDKSVVSGKMEQVVY